MAAPALGLRKRFVPLAASVDWSHSLASDLEFCGVPTLGIDLAKMRPATFVAASGQTYSSDASGFGATLTVSWANNATTDLAFLSGPFTVAVAARLLNVDATQVSFGRSAYVSESNNQGWALQRRMSSSGTRGFSFTSYQNNAASSYACTNAVTAVAQTYVQIGRSNGSNLRENFVNGTRLATNVNNANPVNSTEPLLIGTLNNVPTIAVAWSRALSNNEIAMFTADPFALLRY